jgi:hypothetical protein
MWVLLSEKFLHTTFVVAALHNLSYSNKASSKAAVSVAGRFTHEYAHDSNLEIRLRCIAPRICVLCKRSSSLRTSTAAASESYGCGSLRTSTAATSESDGCGSLRTSTAATSESDGCGSLRTGAASTSERDGCGSLRAGAAATSERDGCGSLWTSKAATSERSISSTKEFC